MTDADSADKSSRAAVGSLLLLAGMVLLILRGLETSQALPAFPRFWHNHDAIWWGLGLSIAGFGAWVLARHSTPKDALGWRPKRSGRRFRNVILYTRAGCHLCEEARDVLDEYARWLPEIVEVDIDHDPRLVERYGKCVPVVTCDGKVRFRGRVSPILLKRLIEGTAPAEF
jgi:glutaredoxin